MTKAEIDVPYVEVVLSFNPKYSITTLGEVFYIDRGRHRKLTPVTTSAGYKQVTLMPTRETYAVHRLVAKSFLPAQEGLDYVNHIDNDKSNNCVSNLEYVTPLGNVRHSVEQGRQAKGEDQGLSKLTEKDVMYIRSKHIPHSKELGTRPLARRFGVDPAAILSVVKYKTWKHLN